MAKTIPKLQEDDNLSADGPAVNLGEPGRKTSRRSLRHLRRVVQGCLFSRAVDKVAAAGCIFRQRGDSEACIACSCDASGIPLNE